MKKSDTFIDILTPSQRGGATGYLTASELILVALLVRLAIAPAESGFDAAHLAMGAGDGLRQAQGMGA